jgi:NAD(P)H-dependent FMN reductase
MHPLSSLPTAYSDPKVVAWSSTVLSWDGWLVVTPQYNWGIPGILKNALDHLYNEWAGKPAGIITLGGHGGDKCGVALAQVMAGGLNMDLVEKRVEVMLPQGVIISEKRLEVDGEEITVHEGDVLELVSEVVKKVERREATVTAAA